MTSIVLRKKELTILPDYDGSCVVMVKEGNNLDLKAFDELLLHSPLFILWTLCEKLDVFPVTAEEFQQFMRWIEDASTPFRDRLAGDVPRA